MKTHWAISLIAAAALVGGLAIGCGDDDEGEETPEATSPATAAATGTAAGGGAAQTVEVTLKEFEVLPEPASVPAGAITFRATNIGPEDDHELVIIKSDLAPGELPTADDGSADEDQLDVIDEIEEFAVGGTEELTVDLDAGSYVLICNVVETTDGETEAHYELGMRTEFTVE
jgi:uncharacterized cupredoxin-like copper-binding protein